MLHAEAVSKVRYGTLFRCLLQILSTFGDMYCTYLMLLLQLYYWIERFYGLLLLGPYAIFIHAKVICKNFFDIVIIITLIYAT